jgi:hypothetical protein
VRLTSKLSDRQPVTIERHVELQIVCHRKIAELWAVRCSVVLGRSFRNKSSKDIAFPHPKSRKDNYNKEDKPNHGGVVWKFFKRAINITDYRNAKDDVNQRKIERLAASFI